MCFGDSQHDVGHDVPLVEFKSARKAASRVPQSWHGDMLKGMTPQRLFSKEPPARDLGCGSKDDWKRAVPGVDRGFEEVHGLPDFRPEFIMLSTSAWRWRRSWLDGIGYGQICFFGVWLGVYISFWYCLTVASSETAC